MIGSSLPNSIAIDRLTLHLTQFHQAKEALSLVQHNSLICEHIAQSNLVVALHVHHSRCVARVGTQRGRLTLEKTLRIVHDNEAVRVRALLKGDLIKGQFETKKNCRIALTMANNVHTCAYTWYSPDLRTRTMPSSFWKNRSIASWFTHLDACQSTLRTCAGMTGFRLRAAP